MRVVDDASGGRGLATRLRELVGLFGLLGVIGFGGPAAHIALMRREVVDRRGWMTNQGVMDLVGLTSLIPGPNSTELAMLIGRQRAGLRGLLVAGLAFILPAVAIVLALAWAYVSFGSTPAVEGLLYGLKPVLLAIVAAAVISFGRVAAASLATAAVAVAAGVGWLAGLHELLVLALAALAMAGLRLSGSLGAIVPLGLGLAGVGARATAVELPVLFAVFLKAGGLLFGSGYVLLAYLRGDLVERLGWLTDQQLLDAVAIGQVTPGPLFTTATFIGYLLAGVPGAMVATLGIFLPAFIVSALIAPLAPRLRRHALTAALLDGVNAGAVGLMVVVSAQLALAAIVDPLTAALAVGAGGALLLWSPSSVLLLAVGAAVGLAAIGLGIGP
ncbi:MAG TPA: chromate efflux transporter [Candidatus Limnocylindria bacterium]